MKSKLKKTYAKVLKNEGMGSNRITLRDSNPISIPQITTDAQPDGSTSPSPDGTTPSNEASSSKVKLLGVTSANSTRSTGGLFGKGKGKSRDGDASTARLGKDKDRESRDKREGRAERKDEAPKIRALDVGDIGPPMPQTSYRELKKEAFSKYHPKRLDPTPIRHGQSTGGIGGFGGSSGQGRGGRGQPNMGARMGVLLEKIKRDKAGL